MHPLRLAVLALVSGTALAQNTIVSPVLAATVEGNSNNVFPFANTTIRRYMQLHGDLGTTPLVITQLSVRVNASTTNYTGTKAIDMELFMGDGVPALQPSFTFDSNYIGTKTLVLPRQIVNFGPQGQSVSPGPNPFTGNMDLILPVPFVYTGVNSLVWEVTHYGQTTVGTFSALDADQASTTSGASTITGTGCMATGRTALMTHTYFCTDVLGTLLLGPAVTNGPSNSLVILGLGFTNPNLAFPGLCGTVYTDAMITQFLGFTSATGAFTLDDPSAGTVLPNLLAGVQLFTQAFAVDLGSTSPIQFAVSNGRSVTVPTPNTTRTVDVSRLWNNVGGTTATQAVFTTSSIGYGLVTQFTHL